MWIKTYSKFFLGLNKEDLWKKWIDINHWTDWHGDLDYCRLSEPFSVGAVFTLKPKNMPAVKIEITEIVEGRKFIDCTKFFGAKMYNTHEVIESNGGIIISNTLIVTGPLKYLWIFLVARNVAKTVPDEIESLVKIIKAQNG